MDARQYARGTVGRRSGSGSGGAPRGDESREIKSWDSGIRALARGSAAEAVRARRGGVVQRARLGGAGGGAKEKKKIGKCGKAGLQMGAKVAAEGGREGLRTVAAFVKRSCGVGSYFARFRFLKK